VPGPVRAAAPVSASWQALGSKVTVFVTDEAALREICALVKRQLSELDLACSRFRDDSELVRLNRSGGRLTEVSWLLFEVLEVAIDAARVTDGDLDPTIGRALRVAGYDRDFAQLPDRPARRLKLVAAPGWRSILLDRRRRAVRVPAGVELDLGATAKALAADRAARSAAWLTGAGVLVNLGGDLAVAGDPPPGGWPVRVTDDHTAAFDAPGQTVAIAAGGLATSSTAVRRWAVGTARLHHIFDPRAGAPARVVWRTVSVAGRTCADANVASTASIVRGESAPAWLEAAALPARLVAADGSILHVAGWPEPHAGVTAS
jgi:thiamine biosynthesis lipoprotein ApbE